MTKIRVPRHIPNRGEEDPPKPRPKRSERGKILTFSGWILGWLCIVWTLAELTSPWVWPAGVGILLIGLAGVKPLVVVVATGIWYLDAMRPKKEKK